jgi:hypothetical protein
VLRPSISADLSDGHLGAEGDRLLFLVEASLAVVGNSLVIIILDDIDELVNEGSGGSFASNAGGHLALDSTPNLVNGRACLTRQYTCLSNLTYLFRKRRAKGPDPVQVMIVCTAKNCTQGLKNAFDMVCHLEAPTGRERFEIIQSNGDPEQLDQSGAARRCSLQCEKLRDFGPHVHQHAIQAAGKTIWLESPRSSTDKVTASKENDLLRSSHLDQKRQPYLPERYVRVDEALFRVNLVIESARSMLAINDDGSGAPCPPKFPLLGQQSEKAWLQLKSLIVLPLCRADILDKLLYGADAEGEDQPLDKKWKNRKTVCGGALLVGPPGSGLSTLARHCGAVAAVEHGATTLIHVSCASLVQKEVGGSERVIRSLFDFAKCSAPSILVLDGLENVGRVRGNDLTTQGTMDRILTTLLMELDGLNQGQTPAAGRQADVPPNIAVIGIAQHPEWIDPALRRPGRLEKTVELTLPDLKARSMIAEEALKGAAINFTRDTPFYARTKEKLCDWIGFQTLGLTALGIQSICNEAKMESSRHSIEVGSSSCQRIDSEVPNINLTFQNFDRAIKLQLSR